MELVFITAASSQLIGHAFVEAGVPHVVAIRENEVVSSEALVVLVAVCHVAVILLLLLLLLLLLSNGVADAVVVTPSCMFVVCLVVKAFNSYPNVHLKGCDSTFSRGVVGSMLCGFASS